MTNNLDHLTALDFGTKPISAKLESIEVKIDTALILEDFAKAYLKELNRRNPQRFEASSLTEESLNNYFVGLVKIRVLSIGNEGYKDWRKAKQLYIPSWIEFALSRIGKVRDNRRGLEFYPVMENTDVNLDEMLGVSNELHAFVEDGIVLHKDAFPRKDEGDYEVMSMAIMDGYVQSIDDKSHPVASYIAAFLGFSLKKEIDFKMLYRIRYDDTDFIRSALLSEVTLI